MNAVTVAYRFQTGWSLVPPSLYDAPPPGAYRVRQINLGGGDEIRVLCAKTALDLDQWGEPYIGRRAEKWLIDNHYARKVAGKLIVDWPRVHRAISAESHTVSESARTSAALTITPPAAAPERRPMPMQPLNIAPGLDVTADDFRELCFAIYGITRSGKGVTTAVIAEELSPYMPFAVIDVHGEYHGLRQVGARTFGKAVSAKVDVAIDTAQGAHVAEYFLRERRSVILDLSEFDDDEDNDERMRLVEDFLKALWRGTTPDLVRGTVLLVIDEAQNFAPQQGKTPVKSLIRRYVKEGLGRGIVTGVVTQRPVSIDKDTAMQCGLQIMLNVTGTNDLKRYAEMIPGKLMPASQVEDVAFNLERGEALVLRQKKLDRVQIRMRRTPHGRHTPQFSANYQPPEATPESPELEALRAEFAAPETSADHRADPAEIARLRAENERLHIEIAAKDAEIAELRAQIPLVTYADRQRLTEDELNALVDDLHAEDARPAPEDLALDDSLARRERDVQARLLKKERERFDELMARIREWKGSGKRGNWQRDFLIMLRKRGTLSRAQAVSWLHIGDTTFANNPPTPLVRAGLIRVGGKRGNLNYTWRAPHKLTEAFPNLDAGQLEKEILL